MTLRMEAVSGSDAGLETVLASANLPVDDLQEDGRQFFAFWKDGNVVGYGGIEGYGSLALLRSVAVLSHRRDEGLGSEMTALLLEHVRQSGIDRVFLLTTSAAAFFERLGFVRISRVEAPSEILNTRQAASLCPASATLMKIDLTH